MRRLALCVGAFVGLTLGLAGCGGGNATLPAATVTVYQASLNTAIALHVGETVRIVLNANPSTGYQWHCDWAPETGLLMVDNEFYPSQPTDPGAGGVEHFFMRAAQPGTATVTLQYGRWWPGGELQDPKTLTVNVLP